MIYNPRSFVHYPPKIEEILDGEFSTLPHPGQPEYLVAAGAMMIQAVDEQTAIPFMRLMLDKDRFPADESVIVMKLMALDPQASEIINKHADKEYAEWTSIYKGKVF